MIVDLVGLEPCHALASRGMFASKCPELTFDPNLLDPDRLAATNFFEKLEEMLRPSVYKMFLEKLREMES